MSDQKTIKDILTGVNGKLAIIFEGIAQYGGPAGKRVGAIANIVNGAVAGAISYVTGNPTEEEQRKIGNAIFAGSVAVGLCAVTVVLGTTPGIPGNLLPG